MHKGHILYNKQFKKKIRKSGQDFKIPFQILNEGLICLTNMIGKQSLTRLLFYDNQGSLNQIETCVKQSSALIRVNSLNHSSFQGFLGLVGELFLKRRRQQEIVKKIW